MSRCVALSTFLVLLSALLPCARAHALVERFALIVGNNRGLSHEAELRFAEADAQKLNATLREIGDFAPANVVLLEGASADEARRTLITLNDRIRAIRSAPNGQAVLLVYFSGHADSEDLHLGQSRLSISELSQLVRGSSADFRLLILDACRSGVLTRGKGGHPVKPFEIPEPLELHGEGLAFLTASAENELAQESDALGGSFFTHALVTGLLGAADRDRDGNVLLDEAYQYAYESTLRASSRSARGLQHPTFFYDLRGQGELVLSRPFHASERRGMLELPRGASYLVLRDGEHGRVIAELGAGDPVRTLSLAPGTYFVRGRTTTHVLEGLARVEIAGLTRVRSDALTRIEYAHLLRKGGLRRRVRALELQAQLRTPLPNADTPCYGALAGYRVDSAHASWSLRAGYCTSTMEHPAFESRADQLDLGVRGIRAFDLGARISIDVGAGVAYGYFTQRFEGATRAPTRHSSAPIGELLVGTSIELGRGTYATADVALQAYLMTMVDDSPRQAKYLRAAASARLGLGLGTRF
ncbi:MAG: putative repeat protein [Myxococcaceae bacterium]|nr:putative repeat protein [Myxococcaceae bacterium]